MHSPNPSPSPSRSLYGAIKCMRVLLLYIPLDPFLGLFPMVLKNKGLSISAAFLNGSYIEEPCLLALEKAWLCECTSQTTDFMTGSYRGHLYRSLHLQRSLSCQSGYVCIAQCMKTLFTCTCKRYTRMAASVLCT